MTDKVRPRLTLKRIFFQGLFVYRTAGDEKELESLQEHIGFLNGQGFFPIFEDRVSDVVITLTTNGIDVLFLADDEGGL